MPGTTGGSSLRESGPSSQAAMTLCSPWRGWCSSPVRISSATPIGLSGPFCTRWWPKLRRPKAAFRKYQRHCVTSLTSVTSPRLQKTGFWITWCAWQHHWEPVHRNVMSNGVSRQPALCGKTPVLCSGDTKKTSHRAAEKSGTRTPR